MTDSPNSDEGELSDLSDEERRRREEYVVTAPPPSPVHPSNKKTKPKGQSKPKQHPVVTYSPPVQRKTMQIPTARLDLETSPDWDSSGDELLVHSSQYPATGGRQVSPKKDPGGKANEPRTEPISMPPELIVTSSCQPQDANVFERLYKTSDPSKGHSIISKPVSRKGSCRKSPDLRNRRKLVRQNGEQSDPEYRPPSEASFSIKKTFWKALSNDNIPWSYNYNEHEEVLRACSEKLAELKKKHKSKGKDRLELDLIGTPSKLTPAKRRIKRRAKSMRIERGVTFSTDSQLQIESFKLKPNAKPDFKKLEEETAKRSNNKKSVNGRKFRKGGIVSLATVSATNGPEQVSGDESTETFGMKKKKKKRKILQISKTVKSAVSAVTAVTVTRKDVKKEPLKKKY